MSSRACAPRRIHPLLFISNGERFRYYRPPLRISDGTRGSSFRRHQGVVREDRQREGAEDRHHRRTERGRKDDLRTCLPARVSTCPRFINADLIAAGLSPFWPEAAAIRARRLMLQEIATCVAQRESFAFETTLAGQTYLRHILCWRALGYQVNLFFLSLPNVELALARVAERVRQGGHDVPGPVIRRRLDAGRSNFENHYRAAVDAWAVYDNSGEEPVLVEWGERP